MSKFDFLTRVLICMPIQLIETPIEKVFLFELAKERFGDLVKAVVDVERQIMMIGAELHADAEGLLLEDGSKQQDLWGINIYPDKTGVDMIEFDSMINLRPSQNNSSRGVNEPAVRKKIIKIVLTLVQE